MKSYEQEYSLILDSLRPYCLRIDGHRFSKFTKPFRKPYDPRISVAMERTALDLMEYFKARAAYTFSDEITLALLPTLTNPPPFRGKIAKLISIASGYASARFNHHISSQEYHPHEEAGDKAHRGIAHFDARAFSLPSDEECLENLLWRSADCMRNSVNNLGRAYYSARQLDRKSNGAVLRLLRHEHNVEWNDYPDHFKHGTLIKKRLAERQGINPQTKESVLVVRGEYVKASVTVLREAPGDESGVAKFLMAKYANQIDTPVEHPAAVQDPAQSAELSELAERLTQRFTPFDYEPVKAYS